MNKFSRILVASLFLGFSSVHADIELVTVSSSGVQANASSSAPVSLSADGNFVAFQSFASNLVAGDTNGTFDIFVHDRGTGTTERVNLSSSGVQANNQSANPSISADGRFVAFQSYASNLVADDTNGTVDVFVHDRNTGVTERVSLTSNGAQGNHQSASPSISADGRIVAFYSNASNLVAGDSNNSTDIFIHDRQSGVTEIVSVSSTGALAEDSSAAPSLSADGRFIAFISFATNLVENDVNELGDIFVHDRSTGTTELVSVSSTGEQANGDHGYFMISANGRFVVFSTEAGNLVNSNPTQGHDVLVHDRSTKITELITKPLNGVGGYRSDPTSERPAISADGRFVVFHSNADYLVENDNNQERDVFLHDRNTGATKIITLSANGVQANRLSSTPAISADGHFAGFVSRASNLVDVDVNGYYDYDVFVFENTLINTNDDLVVTLNPTSVTTEVGQYTRFRARFKNNSNSILTNCRTQIVNPVIPSQNYQRQFSFNTWPIKVTNPVLNGPIDIAPGATGQMNLAVFPRVEMRQQVSFEYLCDNNEALTIPFINTVHLVAKTEPFIAQDFVQLKNSNNRIELVIDRGNGKYWTGFAVKVSNTGSEATSVYLTTTSNIPDSTLRQSRLCEPQDPANGNWSCISPRDTQLQVDLEPGETKRILVYVHARESIDKKPVANRIHLEARDGAGQVVAKTSMGISTIN